jgi:GAF domain-containing protein
MPVGSVSGLKSGMTENFARDREAATREILAVISTSRDDDRPVFDTVLRNAIQLCGAQTAALILGRPTDANMRLAAWSDITDGLAADYDAMIAEVNATAPVMDPAVHLGARAICSGKAEHILDAADTDSYRHGEPTWRLIVDEMGTRTMLSVPLRDATGSIGAINLHRREVRLFTADEIALVETFAAQAVIAIENVRQFRELQTRLAREAATREILEVISQSRDDDAPVFDAVLRNANRLCGTSMAYLVLGRPDDTHMTLAAYVNPHLPSEDSVDQIIAFSNQTRMRMDADEHFSARAIISGEVVQIADIAVSPGYLSGEPTTRILVEDVGVRTILSVPLFDAQGTIGAISLQRREERLFSDDEISLIQSFAAQAVIAIENVRQFRELQVRLAREAATREILEVISQSRDDDKPVFEVALRKAAELCHAPMASLLIISEDRSHAVLAADWGHHDVSGFIRVGETIWPLDSDLAAPICMREGRIVHLEDLADSDLYRSGDPLRMAAVDQDGIRTLLAVPLFSGGRTVGCIYVYRREVAPFKADEIALVETFAAQAVIAIENARQFRELQSRLAREAATREILEVISRNPDDDRPVFDAILGNAIRLCGSDTSALFLGRRDDPRLRLAAWRDRAASSSVMEDEMIARVNATPMLMDPSVHVSAQAIIHERNIHIPDVWQHPSYLSDEPSYRIFGDALGIRSILVVPLIDARGALGVVQMHRRDVRPFTADEIALVETFAAQAVIAIENVRQFRELQVRLAREAATREILEVISQSRDDETPVFDAVLRKAAELCGAPLAGLNIISEDRSHAVMVAHWGDTLRALEPGKTVWPLHADLVPSIAMRQGRVVQERDLADTDAYRSGDPIRRQAVDEEGIRTIVVVPLFSGGRTIGSIALYRRDVAPFTSDEIALVETFAAQAVIAIENVRQFRELEARLEREKASAAVLRMISSATSDIQPVFDMIALNAAGLCGAVFCTLWRVQDGVVHYCAGHGFDGEVLDEAKVTAPTPLLETMITDQVFKKRGVVRIDDAMSEDYYDHKWTRAMGVRQIIGVPIFVGDDIWGSINLMWREGLAAKDSHVQLVESFADQASIAIENARLLNALEALNAELGDRVQDQVGEIERMGRLKRFLPAAVADTVISTGSEKLLASHRALLGVLFCDIRGFTAFCETAEPEETIEVLQTYHEEMGKLIEAHGAGVDHRMGDGIMVLFNDPIPCDDPAGTAVRLAVAMRERMAELCTRWKKMGHRLGFGVGISLGYATVGMVGSGGRFDYTASGTAVNLAARLCDEALDGEILLSPRASIAVEDRFAVDSRGEMTLKGIREPVEVFRLAAAVEDQMGDALTG